MDTLTMRQRDGLPTETALPDGTLYRTDAQGMLTSADGNGVDPRHQADLEAAGYVVDGGTPPVAEPAPDPPVVPQ